MSIPRNAKIHSTHYLKEGDFGADVYIEATLEDAEGAVTLTGRTVRALISRKLGEEPIINSAATPDNDQGSNPGVVRWFPSETESAFAGALGSGPQTEFLLEWEVRTDGSSPVTFPRDGYDLLIVTRQLGSAP